MPTFLDRPLRCWPLALLALVGCAQDPPVHSALHGNLSELRRDIASAERAHELDRKSVVNLARAVAERELTSARGEDGALRVRALRPCALPLKNRMEQRAQSDDDVGAELGLILLELHVADQRAMLERYLRSPSGGWRAVAARAAVRAIDGDVRRALFVDSDERVRRAAFAAAYEAHQPSELEALLESARVDPDPYAQTLATRAAGASGGEHAVLALKDQWLTADDSQRIAIVDAWSEPASFAAGGARELELAADGGAGLAPLSASQALLRAGGPTAERAKARLRRALSDGSDDEKRLAIAFVPLDAESEAALLRAAHEASPQLRVLAWNRLRESAAQHGDALRALQAVAKAKPSSEAEAQARDAALSALAQAGDSSVQPTLVANLHDKNPQTRWRAARGLVHVGDYADAATALADDDPNVRSDVACNLLSQAR